MKKLLDAFAAEPSRESAQRLLRYIDKHPFAVCLGIDAGAALIIGIARDLANKGGQS